MEHQEAPKMEVQPRRKGHQAVYYHKLTLEPDGGIKSQKFQIVGREGQHEIPYRAIDPKTHGEEKLDDKEWVEVYSSLSEKPPQTLLDRISENSGGKPTSRR